MVTRLLLIRRRMDSFSAFFVANTVAHAHRRDEWEGRKGREGVGDRKGKGREVWEWNGW